MADGVTRVSAGIYRVEREGRAVLVYLAGTTDDMWAFCDGEVFRPTVTPARAESRRAPHAASTAIVSPMPATVVAVNVAAGDRVRKGDILLVLDAMKMEMPIRADGDGIIKTVRCAAGDGVAADAILIEMES